MKLKFLLILALFFSLSNCNTADISTNNNHPINGTWHLMNVTGGFASVDDSFERDTITWKFNFENGNLTVVNNNTDTSKQSGLDTGTYSFSILNMSENQYLVVNDQESGELLFLDNALHIDENSMSNGSGADKFYYLLER